MERGGQVNLLINRVVLYSVVGIGSIFIYLIRKENKK